MKHTLIGLLLALSTLPAAAGVLDTPDSYGPGGKDAYGAYYTVTDSEAPSVHRGAREISAEAARRDEICRQDIKPVYCVFGDTGHLGGSAGGSDGSANGDSGASGDGSGK